LTFFFGTRIKDKKNVEKLNKDLVNDFEGGKGGAI